MLRERPQRIDAALGGGLDGSPTLSLGGELPSVECFAQKVDLPVGDGRFARHFAHGLLRFVVVEESEDV